MSDTGDNLKVFGDEDGDYEDGERQQADFIDGDANGLDSGESARRHNVQSQYAHTFNSRYPTEDGRRQPVPGYIPITPNSDPPPLVSGLGSSVYSSSREWPHSRYTVQPQMAVGQPVDAKPYSLRLSGSMANMPHMRNVPPSPTMTYIPHTQYDAMAVHGHPYQRHLIPGQVPGGMFMMQMLPPGVSPPGHQREAKVKNVPHIKKPLNAFMLYMKEQRAKVIAECTLKESAAINQILGKRWHSLDKTEQAKYYEMARAERARHLQMYPGWSARENYAALGRRKRRRKDRSEEGGADAVPLKKCRARFGLEQLHKWCKPCRRKKKCIKFTSADDVASDDERLIEKRADGNAQKMHVKDEGDVLNDHSSGSEISSDDVISVVISVVGSDDDSDDIDINDINLSEDEDGDERRRRESREAAARAAMPPPERTARTPVSVITSPGLPPRTDPLLIQPPTPPQELFQSVLRSLASPPPDSSCRLGTPSPLSSSVPLSLVVGTPASVLEQPQTHVH